MKKRIFVFIFCILLAVSFVSAGWWDTITGKTIDDSCEDSDGGAQYYSKGTVMINDEEFVDKCKEVIDDLGKQLLTEWVCGDNSEAQDITFICPWGCEDGACIISNLTNCIDTDNSPLYDLSFPGLSLEINLDNYPDLFIKGKTTAREGNSVDFCNKGGKVNECSGPDCYLNEHFCFSESLIGQKSDILCPNGCKDGACLKGEPSVCTDTDGGKNYDVKGYITESGVEVPDYCIDSYNLKEFFCDNRALKEIVYKCPDGCEDGACVEKIKSCQEEGGIICKDYQVCDGIILKANDTNRCCGGDCKLPHAFDWSKRHGENLIPPLNIQKGSDCHEVATVGAFEAQINFYYNQKLDEDLSIQMFVDCKHDTGEIDGLYYQRQECSDCSSTPYCSTMYTGIADESCDPYVGRDIYCDGKYFMQDKCCNYSYVCSDWQERIWKNSDFISYGIGGDIGSLFCEKEVPLETEDEIKRELILKGPMKAYIRSAEHSAVLFGYNELSDWKAIDKCDPWNEKEFCVPSQGCIDKNCNPSDEDFSVCIRNIEVDEAFNYTFTCKQEYENGPYSWFKKDVNVNPCVTEELIEGDKSCHVYDDGSGSFNQVVEYRPGKGDPIWIFNLGVGELNEQRKSIYDLSMLDVPLGPFIPPKGESYEINCVDKDNDNFCNWGTTNEKPLTCPSNCEDDKDWDDSNASIGALGQDDERIEIISNIFKNKTQDNCPQLGFRNGTKYCSVDKRWLEQKDSENVCDNNFECLTNLCIDGKCVSSGVWQKFLKWLSRLFG